MDKRPIRTRLTIDVAIGLDLARTLPSTRANDVITASKRLFIHVIVTQALSRRASLATLQFCSYFHRLPTVPLRFNVGIIYGTTGSERHHEGVQVSSIGTPALDFRSLFLLVGGVWRAAVPSLAECALSFKRVTSPHH